MSDVSLVEEEAEIEQLFGVLRSKIKEYRGKTGRIYTKKIQDGTPVRLPAKHMENCRALADRVDMLVLLPKGGKVAEVGNFFGDFSVKIVEAIQPVEFHTFDWNLDKIRPENRTALNLHGSVFFHDGDPATTFMKFPDRSFDFIYLNKSKNYGGVWNELTESLRMLNPGGYIVVNDYTAWDPVQCIPYGVLPAVNQFAIDNNLDVPYVSFHDRGFLGIALRRMEKE
jgi:SAM-dependent methyltransferase